MPNYQSNFQPYYNMGMPNYNTYQPPVGAQVAQPIQTPIQQPIGKIQPISQMYIQGKSVDSIDVVKAMDIPLDGTISYFPLTDGSAIVTKQLQENGASKTIIYKPVEEKDIEPKNKYITLEEFNKAFEKLDLNVYDDDIKSIKRKINDVMEDIKDIHNSLNKRKD